MICKIKNVMLMLMALASMVLFIADDAVVASVSVQESKIQNKTDNRNANFSAMIDRLKYRLVNAGFSVVDEQDMADALTEHEKANVFDGMEGDEPMEGGLKVPGYWMRLSISQYSAHDETTKDTVNGTITKIPTAKVVAICHLVDARSGKTIKSVQGTGEAKIDLRAGGKDKVVEGNLIEEVLQQACDICVNKFVDELYQIVPMKFRPKPLSGKILAIKKGRIIVSLNADQVKPGMVLDVYRLESLDDEEEEEEEDGDDDDIDLSELMDEVYVGTIQVIEAGEKISTCQLFAEQPGEEIKKKNIVKISTRFKPGKPKTSSPTQPRQPKRPAAPF